MGGNATAVPSWEGSGGGGPAQNVVLYDTDGNALLTRTDEFGEHVLAVMPVDTNPTEILARQYDIQDLKTALFDSDAEHTTIGELETLSQLFAGNIPTGSVLYDTTAGNQGLARAVGNAAQGGVSANAVAAAAAAAAIVGGNYYTNRLWAVSITATGGTAAVQLRDETSTGTILATITAAQAAAVATIPFYGIPIPSGYLWVASGTGSPAMTIFIT